MKDEANQSCFVAGISVSFQNSFFFYANWISPVTLLLSIWCFVSNASVIIALFRSGIRSIRPGLLMVCSLIFSDLIWGAIVTPVNSVLRIKHLNNSARVCEVYSALTKARMHAFASTCVIGTLGNLAIISIDRYLAVKSCLHYKFVVTRHRAFIACALVWLMAVTMGILREVVSLATFHFLVAVLISLTIAVIIIAQIMSLRLLHRHNNAVAQNMEDGNQGNFANTVNAAIERRLSKTTTYVVGILALLFIPGILIILISYTVTKKSLLYLANPILHPIFTLFSGINPVLYYRGNDKIKEGIVKLVKCQ